MHEDIENALLNEADPIEFAASEYRCAMKVLDDLGIPEELDTNRLSLVGRLSLMHLMERRKLQLLAEKLEYAGWQYAQEQGKSCTDPEGWIKWADSQV
jgi:hypothetical protein